MNLDFAWLADPLYLRWLASGTLTTMAVSALGFVLMCVLGVLGAMVLHFRVPVLAGIVTVLVELFRNTPSLVQLFFLYFMLSEMGVYLSDPVSGGKVPLFSGFACVVLMLGLYNGAIAVEIIRSGILAVPSQTVEGARSLGYTRWQIFRYVELPMSVRLTAPLMANNIVTLIKTSSQASLVAVADLVYAATQIMAENFKSLEVMIVVWLIYIVLVSVAVAVIGVASNHFAIPGYGK